MKLYYKGHDYLYASEQIMLVLFPDERPEYPQEGEAFPPSDGAAAEISLSRGAKYTTVITRIVLPNGEGRGSARFVTPKDDAERERLDQRALKLSFYRAAMESGVKPPVWGALTGVRPAKLMEPMLEAGMTRAAAVWQMEKTYLVSHERAQLCADAAIEGIRLRRDLQPNDVGLYIGIPFCPTRCAYCSFVSQSVEKSLKQIEPFTQALLKEIAATGEAIRRAGLRVRAVYMGGGTPTTLNADQLRRVLGAVHENFDLSDSVELTVEAGRPDTIDRQRLAALRDMRVGRISINPQTMNDEVLHAIGRRHSADEVLRAFELSRKMGDWAINMDLIAGLPADTVDGFIKTLDTVIALGAEDVTVHTLALKKGSRITLEGTHIPAGDEVGAMLDYTNAALRRAEYEPYYLYRQKFSSGGFENVGWRRPGGGSFYNVVMMEELCHIVAMGGGGSTKLNIPGGRIERLFNPKYPMEYMRDIDSVIAKKDEIVRICTGK